MLVIRDRILAFLKGGNKRLPVFLILGIAFFGVFGFFSVTHALDISGFIANFIFWIFTNFTHVVIILIELVLDFMVNTVLDWQDFITAPAVVIGWRITRDTANMFFSVVLIVIAIGTILGIQRYHYKQYLARLIIMIVLVNFSKTICGLIIDFSQIVMLTFASAVIETGVGNFMGVTGLIDLQNIDESNADGVDPWGIALGAVLAFFMASAALSVFIAMTAMLVIRMVYLWVLIILSPFAYLASTFERGKQFHGRWWSEFIGNVAIGPILAFFIYLAFATVKETNALIAVTVETDEVKAVSPITKPSTFATFFVGMALLIAGIKVASEAGGGIAASRGLQSTFDRSQRFQSRARRAAVRTAAGVAGQTYRTTLGRGVSAVSNALGLEKASGALQRAVEGATALPVVGYFAEGGLNRTRRFSRNQVEAAKKSIGDMNTDQLMRTALQGGARAKAAKELLSSKKNVGNMEKLIENNMKDGKPVGKGAVAAKMLQNAYDEAKDRGDDVSHFESKYLHLLSKDSKKKVIEGMDSRDAKNFGTSVLKDSETMDMITENQDYQESFNQAYFQVRTDRNTGKKYYVTNDGGSYEVGKGQIETADLLDKGKFQGSIEKKNALTSYFENKKGTGISLSAMRADHAVGETKLLDKMLFRGRDADSLTDPEKKQRDDNAKAILGILKSKDKGSAMREKQDILGNELAANMINNAESDAKAVLPEVLNNPIAKSAMARHIKNAHKTYASGVEGLNEDDVQNEIVKASIRKNKELDARKARADLRVAKLKSRSAGKVNDFISGAGRSDNAGGIKQRVSTIDDMNTVMQEFNNTIGSDNQNLRFTSDEMQEIRNVAVRNKAEGKKRLVSALKGRAEGTFKVGDVVRPGIANSMDQAQQLSSIVNQIKNASTRDAGLQQLENLAKREDFAFGGQINEGVINDIRGTLQGGEIEGKLNDLVGSISGAQKANGDKDVARFMDRLKEQASVANKVDTGKKRLDNLIKKGKLD